MLYFTLTIPSDFSRDFKRKARRYWATDGGVVGDLLCFDRLQTLVQVRDADQRHFSVYSHCDHTFGQYLAHRLAMLTLIKWFKLDRFFTKTSLQTSSRALLFLVAMAVWQ